MSYGLKVINDNSYVQIDSETPRLCALYNGTYSAGSRIAIVTFPSPVTTPEPPCIFIQNSAAQADYIYDGATITGSTGNWTGFTLSVNNVNWRPAGKWFCAVFATIAQGNYGMRLWGAGGGLVFDSGSTPVIVTRASNSLSYRGYYLHPVLGSTNYYSFNGLNNGTALLSDEYFMINPFSKGVLYDSPNVMTAGIRWNYSANELQFFTFTNIPGAGWTNQGSPGAVMARLPGT